MNISDKINAIIPAYPHLSTPMEDSLTKPEKVLPRRRYPQPLDIEMPKHKPGPIPSDQQVIGYDSQGRAQLAKAPPSATTNVKVDV